MLTGLKNWIYGILLALLGLSGLYTAAKGQTDDAYYFGLGLALFSIVAMAVMVRAALHDKKQ